MKNLLILSLLLLISPLSKQIELFNLHRKRELSHSTLHQIPNEITISVADRCLRKRVNEFVNANTPIADSLRKYFGPRKKLLVIEQDNYIKHTTTAEIGLGSTLGGVYPTKTSQISRMSMTLNNIPLLHASKEYIAETLIHEVFHLSMEMSNIIPPYGDGGQMHHTIMLTDPKYLEQTIINLQILFPDLPSSHAKAMFFQGFAGYINTRNPRYSENKARWLKALEQNGLSENFVNTRAEWYRMGLIGTEKCN